MNYELVYNETEYPHWEVKQDGKVIARFGLKEDATMFVRELEKQKEFLVSVKWRYVVTSRSEVTVRARDYEQAKNKLTEMIKSGNVVSKESLGEIIIDEIRVAGQ